MRIGLFGGSFNPPHIGHLRAAKLFCEAAKLDILYVVPTYVSPFKVENNSCIDSYHRLQMTKLCFNELASTNTKIIVSDIETCKSQTSYTIDTVNSLLQMHNDDKLYMLVGSDMFCSLERWKSFDELFDKCNIFTLARDVDEEKILYEAKELYKRKYNATVTICSFPALVVSSTEIRTDLSTKKFANLQNLLTKSVLRYIIKNGLYMGNDTDSVNVFNHTPTASETIESIRRNMANHLSNKRYFHTLGVCETALDIANKLFRNLGIDKKYLLDIEAAALLHDYTKNLDLISQKELCVKYGIKTDSVSCDSVNLLHSKTAAHLARELYNINDVVFHAIFHHTTGCESMNIIDKIVFISDYIEPSRTVASCVQLRNSFYCDFDETRYSVQALDRAVLRSLHSTIEYLLDNNIQIDIETLKAYNSLTAQCS